METNNIILNELKEISPAVANIDRRNVYSVSSGYFNDLSDVILNRIKKASETISIEATATPFSVPSGYFDGLSSQILSKIKQHDIEENEVVKELAEIAPFLNTIKRENPYSVPSGYFENLQIPVQKKLAKVVSFSRTRRFVTYAAAAAITGIMAIGGVFYMNDKNEATTTSTVAIFKQEDLKNLSEQEIIEYLDANATTGVKLTTNIEKNTELKQTKELTDEEILNYLNENPEPGDSYQQEG